MSDSSKTCTVFVGGISWKADEESLKQFFSSFGGVVDCKIIVDRETNKSKGYGFVTFSDPDTAESVKQATNLNFLGKVMNVGDAYRKNQTSKHNAQMMNGAYGYPMQFYGNHPYAPPMYGYMSYPYPYDQMGYVYPQQTYYDPYWNANQYPMQPMPNFQEDGSQSFSMNYGGEEESLPKTSNTAQEASTIPEDNQLDETTEKLEKVSLLDQ